MMANNSIIGTAGRVLFTAAVLALSVEASARQEPNYELAARFSINNISQMVHSTSVYPNWFEKSNRFWYSWTTGEGTKYYIVDPQTATKTEVFDMEKLAMQLTTITRDPVDAQHIKLDRIELKDDKVFRFDVRGTQEVRDTLSKDPDAMTAKIFHFEYDIASKTLTEYRPEDKKYPHWASVSPDGTKAVYAKDNNLWWMDAENLKKAAKDEKDSTIVEHRITEDGIRDYGYGYGSYAGNTDSDTTRRSSIVQMAWSPDSKHFATFKFDMREIKDFWVINSLSNPRPTLETYKYQMPGEPSPKEELYIFNIEDGSSKHIKSVAFKGQVGDFEFRTQTVADRYRDYRSRVWAGDEDGFYYDRISRDAHKIDFCRVDIASDSTRTILSERMNTYLDGKSLRFIRNGSQFIEWSERNGWANLYLYNADGKLVRNLTEGAYHVDEILAVNEKEGYVLFSACGVNKGENPYQMHTYRVSLNGGAIRQLDMDDMDVTAYACDDATYFVANCSRVDYAPEIYLVDRNGKRTLLEKADLSKLYEAGYRMPERFKVKAADGITDLYGAMYKPFDFDSTKCYPIIDYVYPGPQVEANNISWSKGMLRTDRLAQIGFVVITVGNRGGHPNRSKWYHNYGYGNLRDYGLEDQKTAVEQLAARHKWIDGTKVGILGHSGGGFMSTAAILTYPDFYTAAVSCSGNHDNAIYNRWWSETHHGIKEKVADGDTTFVFSIKNNQEIAGKLKGHLMLVTGDIDDNVHPANTIRVVNALIRANKRFDLLVLPGQRHGYDDMNEYFFYRLADYFSEWLLGSSHRSEVDIRQMNND